MKLGVGYNIWDCEELLERSIESIRFERKRIQLKSSIIYLFQYRAHTDYVVVVYQTVSNFGASCSPYLEELLNELKDKGLIGTFLWLYVNFFY